MRIGGWSSDVCCSDLVNSCAETPAAEEMTRAATAASFRTAFMDFFLPSCLLLRDGHVAMHSSVVVAGHEAGALEDAVLRARKSVGWGKSESVRGALGGRGIIKEKENREDNEKI